MTRTDQFVISILNALLSGEFLSDLEHENELGFNEVETATMKYNIKKGKINASGCIKDRNSALFIMLTKTLAFLTMFTHGHDDKVSHYTGKSVTELKKDLETLWGKPVTENEYHAILNQ